MKKWILCFGLSLFATFSAFAQSTTVSGTVTDAGSQAWAGGTFQFQFVPNPQFPTGPYTWTGGTLNKVISGTLNGSGAYSQSVPSNSAISPQGSKWILQVTPNATSPSFSTPATTITGGTQTLNVTPPAISINWTIPPGPAISAYADGEIVTANLPKGAEYFNTTTGFTRVWNGTIWANQGGGGGGTCPAGTDVGGNSDIQLTNGTNCIASDTLTFNVSGNSLNVVPAAPPNIAQFLVSPDLTLNPLFQIVAHQTASGGLNLLFQTTSSSTSHLVGNFYGSTAFIVPFVSTVSSFGNNGGGTPFTTAGLWALGQDGRTADGETGSGQTVMGIVGGTSLRKTSGNVAYQAALVAQQPSPDTGFTGAPLETAVRSYGLDIFDQQGISTTEQAGIRIQSQTTPGAGAKWSILANTGAGIANFGDGIDDGTLTSGRCVQAGANGRLTSTSAACATTVSSIPFTIDGGGLVPATGIYGQASIPTTSTITGWVITADQSCSAVVDVLRSTYAGFPTTSSIAGTDKPTLSAVQKNENLGPLASWGSTAITAGDQIQINLNSVATCTRINLTLNITTP